MPPELSALTDQISLTPDQYLGIPIALIGAVFLALGTQFQHRGVTKVESNLGSGAKAGLSIRQLMALVSRPSWVIGSVMLGLAILLQLTSLGLAPLIVVQPLGAVALVVTAIVNSRVSRTPLTRKSVRAILFCIVGVGIFVTIAAFNSHTEPIDEHQLITILIMLGIVLVLFAIFFALLRKKFKAIFYILGAGVLFGFVATLAKVVIARVEVLFRPEYVSNGFEWLTAFCVVALLAASLLGGYFVQSAHSHGPPDLVVAGLTVVDPIVAVTIGIVVLNETAGAPLWTMFAFLIAGAIAVYGVFLLSNAHLPKHEDADSVA